MTSTCKLRETMTSFQLDFGDALAVHRRRFVVCLRGNINRFICLRSCLALRFNMVDLYLVVQILFIIVTSTYNALLQKLLRWRELRSENARVFDNGAHKLGRLAFRMHSSFLMILSTLGMQMKVLNMIIINKLHPMFWLSSGCLRGDRVAVDADESKHAWISVCIALVFGISEINTVQGLGTGIYVVSVSEALHGRHQVHFFDIRPLSNWNISWNLRATFALDQVRETLTILVKDSFWHLVSSILHLFGSAGIPGR